MPTAAAIRAARGRAQLNGEKKRDGNSQIAGPKKNAYAGVGQYGSGKSKYAQKRGRQVYGGPIKMSGTEKRVFELARQEGISPDDARARIRQESERARTLAAEQKMMEGLDASDRQEVNRLERLGYSTRDAVNSVKAQRSRPW